MKQKTLLPRIFLYLMIWKPLPSAPQEVLEVTTKSKRYDSKSEADNTTTAISLTRSGDKYQDREADASKEQVLNENGRGHNGNGIPLITSVVMTCVAKDHKYTIYSLQLKIVLNCFNAIRNNIMNSLHRSAKVLEDKDNTMLVTDVTTVKGSSPSPHLNTFTVIPATAKYMTIVALHIPTSDNDTYSMLENVTKSYLDQELVEFTDCRNPRPCHDVSVPHAWLRMKTYLEEMLTFQQEVCSVCVIFYIAHSSSFYKVRKVDEVRKTCFFSIPRRNCVLTDIADCLVDVAGLNPQDSVGFAANGLRQCEMTYHMVQESFGHLCSYSIGSFWERPSLQTCAVININRWDDVIGLPIHFLAYCNHDEEDFLKMTYTHQFLYV